MEKQHQLPIIRPFQDSLRFGNKYFIIQSGNSRDTPQEILKHLHKRIPGLKEVFNVEECDVILDFCPIVSRAGTDMEAALNELNRCSAFKPAVFMVLHHTYEREKIVPDSSRFVSRGNTLTVNCLFNEDAGLLECAMNDKALIKIIEHFESQTLWQQVKIVLWFIIITVVYWTVRTVQIESYNRHPECQQRGGASNFNMMIPKDELCTIAGNKYYIHIAGSTFRAHVHIRNFLQQITGLEEVTSVDKCDIILVICTVVSRAGTDIEAALNALNKHSDSKPSVFMVLHHTFDQEKIVPESSKCVNRKNTLTVDILFHEDEGLLKCMKNKEALDRMQQWMLPQTEKKSWYDTFHDIWETLKLWTNMFFSSQTDLTVASELMIVLLGLSESGKTAVGNMVRKEMGKDDVSTAIQNITVDRGTVAGEKVSLIDTPDWFNSVLSVEEIKEQIQFCISMCSSKPYAVLLVIPVKNLTKEEEKIVEIMNTILEKSSLERVMVIFSTDDQENQKIELLMQHQNVKNLMGNCGNNSVNLAQTGNSAQVSDMLKKIEKMVAGKEESSDVFKLTESDMNTAIAKFEQGDIEKVKNYIKIKLKELQQTIWISKGSAGLLITEQIVEDDFVKIDN